MSHFAIFTEKNKAALLGTEGLVKKIQMKVLPMVVLALALGCFGAQARLGETKEQLEARLGKPLSESNERGYKILLFKKENFSILCLLSDNKTVSIIYQKNLGFTESEVQAILEKNSTGGGWVEFSNNDEATLWKEESSQRSALYDKKENKISFTLDKMVDRHRAEQKRALDSL